MYTTSYAQPDQVAITGKFVSSNYTWASVFHGKSDATSPGTPGTSTDLLAAIAIGWNSVLANLSADVVTDLITVRQMTSTKAAIGRLFDVTITASLGALSTVTINDAGLGYATGSATINVLDTGPGTGGKINVTYSGGVLSTATVFSPGSGYVAPYIRVPLPNAVPGNKLVFAYGSSDVATSTAAGLVATDRQPSFDAVSIRLRSAAPGRYGRSSAHNPGVPESATTNDSLNVPATYQAGAVQLYASPLSMGAGHSTWQCVTASPAWLYSLGLYPALPSPGTYFPFITSCICNPKVGSMLRRKVRLH